MADFRVADPAASGSQRALGQYFAAIGVELGFETGRWTTRSRRSRRKAVGLYESRGYERVPDNGNADADVWFSKPLARGR